MPHSAEPREAEQEAGEAAGAEDGSPAAALAAAGSTVPLWPHQERALAAFSADQVMGTRSTYLVIPPGGGKTMIGLEAARRAGRCTLVLCPNTAIQAQW